MRPADLLDRPEGKPIKPFRLHQSDGTLLEVQEPGMVIVGRASAVLPSRFSKDDDRRRIAEHWKTVSLMHSVPFSVIDECLNGMSTRR
ncbi:MAG: hypothetical protein IT449_00845 [Phycisphaerales bacterium]|nr:hypothetical protein [Phycisphaerales bacterium]